MLRFRGHDDSHGRTTTLISPPERTLLDTLYHHTDISTTLFSDLPTP